MKQLKVVLLAVFLCAGGLALAQQAPPPAPAKRPFNELVVDGKVVGHAVAPKPGDICMLCNQPIDKDDTVYLVNGQRVPLHNAELASVSPDRLRGLLTQLRPRGAFLGAEQERPQLSTAWFLFGLYVLVGLIFAAFCAHRALNTGYGPIQWLLAGLFFNIVAYGILLTRPRREVVAPAGVPKGLRKISATYMPEACPMCGTENHPSATACGGCGAKLSPKMVSEVARVGL